MRTRERIKRQHEKAVADRLLRRLKIQATFVKHGDANKREPDAIYRTTSQQTVGIEVVTAYYEDADAQDAAEIATGEKPLAPDEIRGRSAGILIEPDRLICERIETELRKKSTKTYTGSDEVWLCVDVDAGLDDAVSITECVHNLRVPDKHGFSRIYLTYPSAQPGVDCTAVPVFP